MAGAHDAVRILHLQLAPLVSAHGAVRLVLTLGRLGHNHGRGAAGQLSGLTHAHRRRGCHIHGSVGRGHRRAAALGAGSQRRGGGQGPGHQGRTARKQTGRGPLGIRRKVGFGSRRGLHRSGLLLNARLPTAGTILRSRHKSSFVERKLTQILREYRRDRGGDQAGLPGACAVGGQRIPQGLLVVTGRRLPAEAAHVIGRNQVLRRNR